MNRKIIITACVFGLLAVISGAFAAHGLKQYLSASQLEIWHTGVQYQFYHVFALLAVGILFKEYPGKLLKWAGGLFISGIVLFSGSLYMLAVVKAAVLPGYNWVGAITPFGGLCFIAGWISLFIAVSKRRKV